MRPSHPLVVATIVVSILLTACSSAQAPGAPSGSPSAIAPSSPSAAPIPSLSPEPTATPEANPSPAPTPGQLAACPTGPATLETFIGLRFDTGPLSRRYLDRLNERALDCYGSGELAFVAFDANPGGLGGTVAYELKPAWLDTWSSASTFLAASDREAAPLAPFGPFLPVAVPPELRPAFDVHRGQWVKVSGRFDAPAARSCVFAHEGTGADIPSSAELIEMCRTSFVLTSIKPAPNPCPAKDSLQAIIATPEYLRADCFGGRQISFVAVGWPINNVWPGLEVSPDLRSDWVLALNGQTDGLGVFVPRVVNGDGIDDIYPYIVRWEVSGHFDDVLAEACIPTMGDTMDGVPIVKSIGEVRAFCRDHFVVDRLTRLPDAAASPVVE